MSAVHYYSGLVLYVQEAWRVNGSLLHCDIARELGCVPLRVVDLLASWKGRFGRHWIVDVWSALPLCIMWILWKERNNKTFEGVECPSMELELLFLQTLYEWMTALSGHSFSNFLDFLDCCNFC